MKPNFGYKYPRPAVAADCVIFGFDYTVGVLKVLLIERGIDPYRGKMALPGGFVKINCETDDEGNVISESSSESLLECAKRELLEETGLEINYIDELGTFSTPGRDPRGVVFSNAYYALVYPKEVRGGDDAMNASWLPFSEIVEAIQHMPKGFNFLAFDHDQIILKAYTKMQQQLCFNPIGFDLLPETFSMSALQKIYEEILGRRFDRRNFARKMLDSGVLDVVPTDRRNVLYRLNRENYEAIRNTAKAKLLFI